MKTGKVAKMFKVDPKTITYWTDLFSIFFSADSRLSDHNKQRSYSPEDLVVINTIHSLRNQGMSKEEIRLRLEAGYRNQELPPEASTLGADQAIAIYAQLKQYQAELAHTKERLAEKTESEEKLRQKIDELQREVGKWQGQAELYRQLWEEERDDE